MLREISSGDQLYIYIGFIGYIDGPVSSCVRVGTDGPEKYEYLNSDAGRAVWIDRMPAGLVRRPVIDNDVMQQYTQYS